MIRITVESMPTHKGEQPWKVAVGFISKQNEAISERGSYDVRLMRESEKGIFGRLYRRATVTGFPRLEKDVWDLLLCALAGAVGDRAVGAKTEVAIRHLTHEEQCGRPASTAD